MSTRAATATAPAVGAVAAWGAGLLEIALGAGSLTSGSGGPAWAMGLVLVALGAGALAWGAVSLARGRSIVPRVGMAGALAGIGASAAALWMDPAGISAIAVAAASALFVVVALTCGVRLRVKTTDAAPPRLSALIASAVVVAAIATPALSTTEAARLAPDHGSHGVLDPGHH